MENLSLVPPETTLLPRQGSTGNTYLYKGFKAMMSRMVLTISAVSACKHNKDVINKKAGKGQPRPQHKYGILQTLQPRSTEIQPLGTHRRRCALMGLGVGCFSSWTQGKASRATGCLPASTKPNWFLARSYGQVDHSSHLGAKTQFDRGYYTALSRHNLLVQQLFEVISSKERSCSNEKSLFPYKPLRQ